MRGFTLIECLAVVALMALVAATLAVGIAPAAGEARLREARSLLLDLDARARVLAMEGTSVTLSIVADHGEVVRGSVRVPLLERDLAPGLGAGLLDPSSRDSVASVRIGSDGRSPDYVLSLVLGDRRSDSLVAGLTGYAFPRTEVRP